MRVSLNTPDERCASDALVRFGGVHFSGRPHFGPSMTFYGFFVVAKFGFYGPKLL